jgi:AraC family transcriptional regulator of adaptative response / DNA-3-methyladenine glycosylase II
MSGELSAEVCYRALCAHDGRFDGVWFVGVTSTGVYCRPVCRARTPRREHCEFYPSAAAAERRGYRPCLRCRPELAPGRAPVDAATRVATAVAARIADGALNEAGMDELAAEFGLSARQLRRIVESSLGVTPIALAQTQRLLTAKMLLTDSALPIVEVALASGFASVRRFNALFRSRYGLAPSALRRTPTVAASDTIRCQLAYRPPLAFAELLAYLGGRLYAGAEVVTSTSYQRAVEFDGHCGVIRVYPAASSAHLILEASAELGPVLPRLVLGVRRLFDLDAEPAQIAACLAGDPALAPRVAGLPGLRVPGALSGFELALRAVLGQQISVRAATTLAGRLVTALGPELPGPLQLPGLCRSIPTAARLAAARVQDIAAIGLPGRRAECIHGLATAVASGRLRLRPGDDVATTVAALQALPGIGPWTAQYIAMRALRFPDAFPAGDLAIQRALGVTRARDAEARAESWRPFRAYAVMHLWSGSPIQRGL